MQVPDLGQMEALSNEVMKRFAEVTQLHNEWSANPTDENVFAVKKALVQLLKASHDYHSKIVTVLDGDWQPLP